MEQKLIMKEEELNFIYTDFEDPKNKEEARDLTIDFQNWVSEKSLSYEELVENQDYFENMARKFNLVREFRENGII